MADTELRTATEKLLAGLDNNDILPIGEPTATGLFKAKLATLKAFFLGTGGQVPPGGATGTVLTKASGANGDTAWVAPSGGGGGGIADAPSDGTEYVRKDAAWVHSAGGAGGAFGEFAYSPPVAADFAVVTGGTGATAPLTDYAGKGLGMKVTAGSVGRCAAAIMAPPAAPYTMTARLSGWGGFFTGTPEQLVGIILRNSSNGRSMILFRYNDRNLYTQTFVDMNGGGTNTVSGPTDAMFMPNSALYFAVNVDGSGNIQFYYSGDGAQWEPFGAATTAGAFLTASGGTIDQIGIYMGVRNTAGQNGYLMCPFFRVDAVSPPALAL